MKLCYPLLLFMILPIRCPAADNSCPKCPATAENTRPLSLLERIESGTLTKEQLKRIQHEHLELVRDLEISKRCHRRSLSGIEKDPARQHHCKAVLNACAQALLARQETDHKSCEK